MMEDAQFRQSFQQPPTKGQMQMLQKPGTQHLSLFSSRSSPFSSRPLSEATEIADTDFEPDDSPSQQSSRRSAESFGNDSSTTLSTPDELHTPGPYDSGPLDHLRWEDGKPVQGPSGPHLFRGSVSSSTGKIDELEWQFPMSPVKLEDVKRSHSSTTHRPPPAEHVRSASRASSGPSFPRQDEALVRDWTPTHVAEWMYENRVEDTIIERFIDNDISGAVLLDLQIEDLKELDIQSFGKRHGLMNLIQKLRDSLIVPSAEATTPISPPPRQGNSSRNNNNNNNSRRRSHSQGHRHPASPLSPHCDPMSPTSPSRRGRRHRNNNNNNKEWDVVSPAESASIVAIEQLIPKPHHCSKGEGCSKYQRRQRKIARIAEEFPNEFIQVADNRVRTTVTNDSGAPQSSVHRPKSDTKSDTQPSVVASSDLLGPAQQPELNAENLNGVQPRDPQESVRQFLSFQHVNSPIPPLDTTTTTTTTTKSGDQEGQLEMFPPLSPPETETASPTRHMAANLRTLPKLTIPQQTTAGALSSQRTVTPSMGARQHGSATATQECNPYNYYFDTYRQGTPFSEMDVPITAIPPDPLAREASQSAPPHLAYANSTPQPPTMDPIHRPQSARQDHRRQPSFTTNMERLDEGKPLNHPINSPSDMVAAGYGGATTTTSSSSFQQPSSQLPTIRDSRLLQRTQGPDAAHSGYMKKRRTRMLRHEWQDAHFTLKGTVLAMHKGEQDAQRNSRALETMDVDDYAVACSSLASSSKLTAAFKRSLLKKTANASSTSTSSGTSSSTGHVKGLDETAFAFSLIPASERAEKKLFNPSGKSHHFAVKSRDDRINWMRELMLAKALKKGKDGGEEVQMNGNVI